MNRDSVRGGLALVGYLIGWHATRLACTVGDWFWNDDAKAEWDAHVDDALALADPFATSPIYDAIHIDMWEAELEGSDQ